MALAFFVDSPDGLGTAFAAHDEYMAVFTFFVRGKIPPKNRAPLSPDVDDCYMSPYCFMPKLNNNHEQHQHQYSHNQQNQHRGKGDQQKQHTGYLIFVAQVPWLELNPPQTTTVTNTPHQQALDWMRRNSKASAPILGTVEDFQDRLRLKDEEVFTFTKDGCYPTVWDVSQALGKNCDAFLHPALGYRPHRPNQYVLLLTPTLALLSLTHSLTQIMNHRR